MITKLLKYDIKKMTRILVYMYAVSVVLAVITRLINIRDDIQAIRILGMVFAGCTYSAIGNVVVNTFVHIIDVFIKNFYKDESYLTHTLPISKNKLLASKYIASLIVIVASVAVSFVSLFIVLYSKSFIDGIKMFVEATVSGFNISIGLFITLVILLLASQICCLITMAFTAIVKANSYNSKRVIKGVLWFVGFYFAAMLLNVLTAVLYFAISGNLTELLAQVLSQKAFISIFVIVLINYVIYSVLFYIACNRIFNKGVNID